MYALADPFLADTLSFDETIGTFTISTDDVSLLGSHHLHIETRLVDYPTIAAASPVVLPIEFERCPVTVAWSLSDIQIPPD